MARIVVSLGLLMALSACTSAPTVIEYYRLNSTPPAARKTIDSGVNTRALIVESIELSSYLRQPGLALQTDGGRMIISNHHLWAEKLGDAVPKALIKNLQAQSSAFSYYLGGHDWAASESLRLRLRIDNLQATNEGEAVASGRYQLFDSGKAPITRDFSFRRDLETHGYSHAVTRLELLVGDLAELILEDLADLGNIEIE